MYKVTLKQGYQETELEYEYAGQVVDLLIALNIGAPKSEDGDIFSVSITFGDDKEAE